MILLLISKFSAKTLFREAYTMKRLDFIAKALLQLHKKILCQADS